MWYLCGNAGVAFISLPEGLGWEASLPNTFSFLRDTLLIRHRGHEHLFLASAGRDLKPQPASPVDPRAPASGKPVPEAAFALISKEFTQILSQEKKERTEMGK